MSQTLYLSYVMYKVIINKSQKRNQYKNNLNFLDQAVITQYSFDSQTYRFDGFYQLQLVHFIKKINIYSWIIR